MLEHPTEALLEARSMTANDDDGKEFVDDRLTQKALGPNPHAETETRIDRGSSDDFVDDRAELEDKDDSEQSNLTGDFDQRTLSGDRKGPNWF